MKKKWVVTFDRVLLVAVLYCMLGIAVIMINSSSSNLGAISAGSDGTLFLIMDVLAGVYLLKAISNTNKMPKWLAIIIGFVFLQVFGFLLVGMISFTFYMRYFAWVLLMAFFYYYIQKNRSDTKIILAFAVLLLIVLSFVYHRNSSIVRDEIQINYGLNEVYWLLACLPFLLMLKSKLKYLGVLVITVEVLQSYKSAGITALAIGLIVYLYVSNNLQEKRKTFNKVILFVSLLFIALNLININDFLRENLQFDWLSKLDSSYNDGGSGRSIIWINTIEEQGKSSFMEWLIGHGYNTVVLKVEVSAHNDFLEILYDYGIIAFGFYLYFYLELFKIFLVMYRKKEANAPEFASSIVVFFVLSMFSHVIFYASYIMFLSAFWGVAIANSNVSYASNPDRIT